MRGRVAPVGFVRFYRTAYGLAGALAVRPVAHAACAGRICHPADARRAAAAGNIDAQAAYRSLPVLRAFAILAAQAFRPQESP
ncbi:hypothetical protein DIE22_26265 [Burkholderia sp. Bp9142]|nr:hypothetical protein DIE22_26265 [Burkholderia sp. Bp9142]RQR47728.1 hypothetical protein DIE21_25560 [Burkholderia sp. Bp9140]